jgi:glycosyltransferase AglD
MDGRIDFSLILACYNEKPVFRESADRICRTLALSKLRSEIIFVDDGSRDGTPDLIRAFAAKHAGCRMIFHSNNEGRGKTVADGIRMARGKVCGYIDIDCEVSPVYVPDIVNLILTGQADVVIGRRIYRTAFSSIAREIFSIGYQKLADWMVHTGGLDTETGYKFFNRKKILPVLAKATHPHWFWDTEIMVFARAMHLKITEVPVLFLRRTDKKSSVRIISDIADYLANLWQLRQRLHD